MSQLVAAEPSPFRCDVDGAWRVGSTRVTVDTVIAAYQEGATAEEIHLRYDSVALADIHSLIAYYLRHRDEVEAYLSRRRDEAEHVRKQVETRQGVQEIRKRLAARSST
jgi:uncharacterized protein (DUF433 family)